MEEQKIVLKEKSLEVFNYVKNHSGRVSMEELINEFGASRAPADPARSIGASVTDLQKKGLCAREPVAVEGQEKPVVYVNITDAGASFVPGE